jgi:hypothetical protein
MPKKINPFARLRRRGAVLEPRTRTLDLDDLKDLAARMAVASRSFKYGRRLQVDLILASRLIAALLRTGVINGLIDLEGGRNG